jgi:hypothetical protein
MNEKYTKELKESFPDFFKSEEDDKHQFLKYGFQHGDGWFQLVKGLMRCIYNYCENNNKPVPKILQVKEKYGTLRFYIDGDEMNLMLILDQDMHDKLSRLAPHLYALDLGEPRRISSNLQLPGPVVSTIANWLYEGR